MQNDPRVGRFAFLNIYLRHLYPMHFHLIWLLKLHLFALYSIWVLNLHTFALNCLPKLIKVVVDMENWTYPINLDSIFNFDYSVSLGGIHLVRTQVLGIFDPPYPCTQNDVIVTINWPLPPTHCGKPPSPLLAYVLNGWPLSEAMIKLLFCFVKEHFGFFLVLGPGTMSLL